MNDVPRFDMELASGARGGALARRLRFAAWVALALAAGAAVWQGYRNPDLLLGLASFRLC
jgi:hypothetical protein